MMPPEAPIPMKKNAKLYPPYTGTQPFLFLCFAAADGRRARGLLRRLWLRGCRMWYIAGRADSAGAWQKQVERMKAASLVVLLHTAAFASDTDAKSALLACQQRGCPIISIDYDKGDELSLGLTQAQHISRPQSAVAAEEALLHTEGFSQALLGTPSSLPGIPPVLRAAVALAVLAVVLLGAGAAYALLRPAPEPTRAVDEIVFSDPAVAEAVHEAVGGSVTFDAVKTITVLRLNALPADADELSALPNLKRLLLPQNAVTDGETLSALMERYTIELTGGGA